MSQCKGVAQGAFGRAALLEIDKPIVGHAHPHCHLLVKVAGTDSHFQVRGRGYPLNDYNAVAVNSWEPHAYPIAPPHGVAVILALYIRTDWLRRIEPGFAASASPAFFAHPGFVLPPDIRRRVGDLSDALAAPHSSPLPLDALIGELMIGVIDRFSRWRDLKNGATFEQRTIGDFRIRRAVAFMRANIGGRFTVQDVAREVGLSRPHLFAQFKLHTGLTPILFHSALRMESAFDALPGTDQSMAEISNQLGFSRQGHFTRFFRNNLGITPRAYRQLLYRKLTSTRV